jgi:hypothetical protein
MSNPRTLGDLPELTLNDLAIVSAPCVRCGTLVGDDYREGLCLLAETPVPVAWCLDCVDSLEPGARDDVHDASTPYAWHACKVDEETVTVDNGFCLYCGGNLVYVGSAGYVPAIDEDDLEAPIRREPAPEFTLDEVLGVDVRVQIRAGRSDNHPAALYRVDVVGLSEGVDPAWFGTYDEATTGANVLALVLRGTVEYVSIS